MLHFMAVEAQQFPVAAIVWIIVVVMVSMMDRQFPQILAIELARASTANPGIHFERPFAVTIVPRFPLTLGPCNNLVQLIRRLF